MKQLPISKWAKFDNQIEQLITETNNNTEIAKYLLKTNESARKNKDVDRLRTYIKRFRNRGIKQEAENFNIDLSSVKDGWLKSKTASFRFVNPDYKEQQEKNFEELSKELIKDLQNYSPKYTTIKRKYTNEDNLLVVDPADVHIGKLASAFEVGEPYNNQIAVKRVLDGVNGIIEKSKGYNVDKVLFVIGNDILHIDTPKRTTTSGTPQDTDGMWHSNFLIAKQLYVDVIEILLNTADVHVIFNPSNHDYTNGFFLAQLIETHFRNCKNVTFDCSISHRKYFSYGSNLIGTTHGDGAKIDDLALLMAHESKDWVNCKHRYFYVHHFHHKIAKDKMSVCIEALRSPSGTDSWHHRNGYEHAPKAIEGFIHCKKNGQIARFTHLF